MKIWNVLPLDDKKVKENMEKYNLPYFSAALFAARQIDLDTFEYKELLDPFEIKDMDKAINRINLALKNKEKICIYGDYDADGVTSVSMLYLYLKRKGADITFFIPDRKIEGYGININVIKQFAKENIDLIIAVDNGIACFEEVIYAKEQGIDTVIIDHHREQGESVPNACAVVDPHRKDCKSIFKEYCAAGLVFKLLSAMEPDKDIEFFKEYLNLAAVGTIGDAVPMSGENRTIVKLGVKDLENTTNIGLNALINFNRNTFNSISMKNILFGIVPKINAAGRISHGRRVARLLTCEEPDKVQFLAEEINECNMCRKEIQEDILKQAMMLINENPELTKNTIITIYGKNWHQGVIGIVAAKISEKFNKPCIVISTQRDETRGSGRSIEGFSLYEAIDSCKECFTKYGGHHMAVGFSIEPEKIGDFVAKLNKYTKNLPQEAKINKLDIDLSLELKDLDVSIIKQLEALEPFGKTFNEPLVLIKNVTISDIFKLSDGKFVKINIKQGEIETQVICFNYSYFDFPFHVNDKIDIVANLTKNEFRGNIHLNIIANEIRHSNLNYEELFEEYKLFNLINDSLSNNLTIKDDMLPFREDFVLVYNFIKVRRYVPCDILHIYYLLSGKISFFKLQAVINILLECDLLEKTIDVHNPKLHITDFSKKVEIFESKLYKKLKESTKLSK